MKHLFIIIINIYLIGLTLSLRRHNKNEEYTNILRKIKPNSELCNEENCPNNRGTCSGENYCYCFDGYISTFKTSVFCDYEQKDRVVYFLLEFVLSFGIGHFYVGNYISGVIILINYICLFSIYFCFYSRKKGIDSARIRLFLWTVFTIWQVVDGLCIIKGIYTDGKNKPTGFKYF